MSGGIYQYHCRNRYTNNCPEMVYVNNTSCTKCMVRFSLLLLHVLFHANNHLIKSEGLGSEDIPCHWSAWNLSKQLFVPQVNDGTLQYILMEVVTTGEPGNYWTLRETVARPPSASIPTTSDTPRAIIPTTGAPSHVGF